MALNPYERMADATTPLPLDDNHPIRWITTEWASEGGDLTQTQWTGVWPVVEALLRAGSQYVLNPWVSPASLLDTTGTALAFLRHPVDLAEHDSGTDDLPLTETQHLHSLRWAINNLLHFGVVERMIRRIIGASLTCLIEPREELSLAPVGTPDHTPIGAWVLKFPQQEAHRILTLCMKAYRLLDTLQHLEVGPLLRHPASLPSLIQSRNLLACFAMISMQVDPWETRAHAHLRTLGLASTEAQLKHTDIVTRAAMQAPLSEPRVLHEPSAHEWFVKAFAATVPLLVARENTPPKNVGFATVGGYHLARIAPYAFTAAQKAKPGCHWQSIGQYYVSVWMTTSAALRHPLAWDDALNLLKAAGWCPNDTAPYRIYLEDIILVNWRSQHRLVIRSRALIPGIDDHDQPDV